MADDAEPTRADIAVIVIAGVGDDEAGHNVATLASNLVSLGGYDAGKADTVDVPVEPGDWGAGEADRTVYVASTKTITRRGTLAHPETTIDLIEMDWADLSRFPGKLWAFLTTLFGFSLQTSTPGLEALLPFKRGPEKAASTWFRALGFALVLGTLFGVGLGTAVSPLAGAVVATLLAGGVLLVVLTALRMDPRRLAPRAGVPATTAGGVTHSLLEVASWLLAAVVVPVSVVTGFAAVTFWLTVDELAELPDEAALPIVAAVGIWLTPKVGRAVTDGGWTFGADGVWKSVLGPRGWAFLAYLGWLAVEIWQWVDTESPVAGAANSLLYFGGWGVRGTWLAAISLTVLAAVVMLFTWPQARRGDARYRTAALTAAVSPLLVALVAAVLFAGISGLAFTTTEDARWGDTIDTIECYSSASDWSPEPVCAGLPETGDDQHDSWSAVTADVKAFLGGAKDDARLAAQARVDDDAAEAKDRDEAAAAKRDAAADREADVNGTPADWARALLALDSLPVANVATFVLVLLLVLGAVFGGHMLRVRYALPSEEPKLGRALTRFLRACSCVPAVLILASIVLGVFAWMIWSPFEGGGGPTWMGLSTEIWGEPTRIQSLSTTGIGLLLLILLGWALPVDPRNLRATVGGRLETARRILDLPYDIATYMRINDHGEAPRAQVIARYRALMRELKRSGYQRVVFVAHSQGSMLTQALLFGDEHRQRPEAGSSPPRGVLPLQWVQRGLSPAWLLTFGNPIRQTYGARFPGDYEAIWGRADSPALWRRRHVPVVLWVNAYRPRDFIGRPVFRPPLDEASIVPGRVYPHGSDASLPVRDVCLRGSGHHTGYFGDPELGVWADWLLKRVIDDARDVPEGDWPSDYGAA